MSVPYQVISRYEYIPEDANASDDLAFKVGQVITVTEVVDSDWLFGTYKDLATGGLSSGYFPCAFVETYKEESKQQQQQQQPPSSQTQAQSPIAAAKEPEPEPKPKPKPEAEIEEEKEIETPPKPVIAPASSTTSPPHNAFVNKVQSFNETTQPPLPGMMKPIEQSFVKKSFAAAQQQSHYVPPPINKSPYEQQQSKFKQQQSHQQPINVVSESTPSETEEKQAPRMTLRERMKLLEERHKQEQEAMDAALKRKEERKKKIHVESDKTGDSVASGSASIPASATGGSVKSHSTGEQQESVGSEIERVQLEGVAETSEEKHKVGENDEDDGDRDRDEDEDEDDEDGEDDEEEDEDDEELRRRRLRERMAKLYGGVSMMGMGIQMGGLQLGGISPAPKSEKKKSKKKKPVAEEEEEVIQKAVPVMPFANPQALPGLAKAKTIQETKQEELPIQPKEIEQESAAPSVLETDASRLPEKIPEKDKYISDNDYESAEEEPHDYVDLTKPIENEPDKTRASTSTTIPATTNTSNKATTTTTTTAAAKEIPATEVKQVDVPPVTTTTVSSPPANVNAPPSIPSGVAPGAIPQMPAVTQAPSVPPTLPPLPSRSVSSAPPPIPSAVPPPPISTTDNGGHTNYSSDDEYSSDVEVHTVTEKAVSSPVKKSPTISEHPRSFPPPTPQQTVLTSFSQSGEGVPPMPMPIPKTLASPTGAPPIPPIPRSPTMEMRSQAHPPPPPPPSVAPPARASTTSTLESQPPSSPYNTSRAATVHTAAVPPAVVGSTATGSSAFSAEGTGGSLARKNSIDYTTYLQDGSHWWKTTSLPNELAAKDIYCEVDKNTILKRNGREVQYLDYYIINPDLSGRLWELSYDKSKPNELLSFKETALPKPTPRLDYLNSSSQKYGSIAYQAASKLVYSRDKELSSNEQFIDYIYSKLPQEALPRIGHKTYGAAVYKNNNNMDIHQIDNFQPGDILVVLKGKFEQHSSGPFKQHKSIELGFGGKPYSAVVTGYDDTKKKLRVIEYSASKGVQQNGYRLGDLKSGRVRVFRVVGRDFLGW